ncbi:MAG: SRPBCC family protein [Lapillicoccus sp.]
MAAFRIDRECRAPLPEVWATVTDFGGYGRWIPLTRMRLDPGPVRLGWGFAGLTGLGPLSFSDSMLVTEWEPPAGSGRRASFRLVKTGQLLGGWAAIELQALGDQQTRLSWREEIVLRPAPLGRRLAPALDPALRHLFAGVLDRMLADPSRRGG